MPSRGEMNEGTYDSIDSLNRRIERLESMNSDMEGFIKFYDKEIYNKWKKLHPKIMKVYDKKMKYYQSELYD